MVNVVLLASCVAPETTGSDRTPTVPTTFPQAGCEKPSGMCEARLRSTDGLENFANAGVLIRLPMLAFSHAPVSMACSSAASHCVWVTVSRRSSPRSSRPTRCASASSKHEAAFPHIIIYTLPRLAFGRSPSDPSRACLPLVWPCRYGVSGGSSASHATAVQPFTVKVHPDVPFLCDLHAHLADSEIIGFLAGRFDREAKCLYIQVRGAHKTLPAQP